MRIAFYAPLKSPDHPVASGDRLMAQLLMRALKMAGHHVTLASDLRTFLRTPDGGLLAQARADAAPELARLRTGGVPDLWFTYHPYYKSPDLLGPILAREWGIPYVTVESSWSHRRTAGDWGIAQELVRDGLTQAALNLCMTARDERGIHAGAPTARTARLAPFIDAAPFTQIPPTPQTGHLITVAMMRAGDKLSSYQTLARALRQLGDGWRLSVAGGGPAAADVRHAFAGMPQVTFLGACDRTQIAHLLSQGAIYVWPGHGEAYGLAYLEAQAAGLPVIAQSTAGVPEVVMDGRTGLLTPPDDVDALRRALRWMLDDDVTRTRMAVSARAFAGTERGLTRAAQTIAGHISDVIRTHISRSPR